MVFLIARENRRKKEKENKSSGVANVSYYVISTFQSVQSLHQFTLSLSCVLVVVDYVITFHCDDDGHFHGLNTQLLNISKQFSCTNRTPSSESTRVECALNDAHVLSLCMPSKDFGLIPFSLRMVDRFGIYDAFHTFNRFITKSFKSVTLLNAHDAFLSPSQFYANTRYRFDTVVTEVVCFLDNQRENNCND